MQALVDTMGYIMKSSPEIKFYPAEDIAGRVDLNSSDDLAGLVLNFIILFNELNTCSPTLDEIVTFLDYTDFERPWKSYAQNLLEQLEKRGDILRPVIPGKTRKAHGRIMVNGARWTYEP